MKFIEANQCQDDIDLHIHFVQLLEDWLSGEFEIETLTAADLLDGLAAVGAHLTPSFEGQAQNAYQRYIRHSGSLLK